MRGGCVLWVCTRRSRHGSGRLGAGRGTAWPGSIGSCLPLMHRSNPSGSAGSRLRKVGVFVAAVREPLTVRGARFRRSPSSPATAPGPIAAVWRLRSPPFEGEQTQLSPVDATTGALPPLQAR